MKMLNYEKRHDPDQGKDYYHAEAEHAERFIEINTDDRAHYVRLDRDPLSVQVIADDAGLLQFFYWLFGNWRGGDARE